MPNLVSLTFPSLRILDKAQMGAFPMSRFLVKPRMNKSFFKSRTSYDVDMKLDDDVVSVNYDVIVLSLINGCFGAIRNPDFKYFGKMPKH